jgi:deoxyribodipyrimidine photo-lyase
VTIWWVRRDLRLADNAALAAAVARGRPVVPLFVVDPALVERIHAGATRRTSFLWQGLAALDRSLRLRGSRLVVRHGAPEVVVPAAAHEVGAARVIAEDDYTPFARRRDAAVGARVPLELVDGLSVHPPRTVLSAERRPYTVFSPFRRAWLARGVPGRADVAEPPPALVPFPAIASDPIPHGAASPDFPAGEDEARRRLDAFGAGARAPIGRYDRDRDRVDRAATSTLSPYLRFGMLSARQAVVAAVAAGADPRDARARSGADLWLSELVWREFYLAVLWHFPSVLRGAFDRSLRRIPWRRSAEDLAAWQHGRTGFPIVDAAMRQLAATGWMHNRARMIVASFLTKDLLLDWRLGEAWFMRQLLDGDPAANNGGWQWTAGTGTDAAPYFRIFNPTLQAKKFDPEGAYVRRWVPELARVPLGFVHEPAAMSALEQQAAGCVIGRDYPAPIVDRAASRARALAAYAAARQRHQTDASP